MTSRCGSDLPANVPHATSTGGEGSPVRLHIVYNTVMTVLSIGSGTLGNVTSDTLPSTTVGDETLDARRQALLEAAVQILATDGPHGLSLRRIATSAGGSTQLVYTLFGGKQGLADALYAEGFRRLDRRACAVVTESGTPVGTAENLIAFGRGYLAFAREEPSFFAVMFGRAIPDFVPSRATREHGRERTFGILVDAVQACLDAGTLVAPTITENAPDSAALRLARLLWASAHGAASLEAAGMIDDPGFAEAMLEVPIRAHRP